MSDQITRRGLLGRGFALVAGLSALKMLPATANSVPIVPVDLSDDQIKRWIERLDEIDALGGNNDRGFLLHPVFSEGQDREALMRLLGQSMSSRIDAEFLTVIGTSGHSVG